MATDLAPTGPALSGVIRLTNHSGHSCTLTGTPNVRVVDANGASLAVKELDRSSTAGARIPVLLSPGGQALVGVSWRNFCAQPAPPTPYSLRITLADGGAIAAPFDTNPPFASGTVPPPCGASTSPSVLLVGAFADVPPAVPHDGRYFPQTGYRIDNDTVWGYFRRRGGITAFGYPTSRTFLFQGFSVQFFQRRIGQLGPDGQARLLNLLDPGLLPYASFNFSTFPGVDSALVATAPNPTDQPAVLAWVRQHAPDVVAGAPVQSAPPSSARSRPRPPSPTAATPASCRGSTWNCGVSRPANR